MIVTCQACTRRYLIDIRSLPKTGRTVRCAACNHTWTQYPLEEGEKPEITTLSAANTPSSLLNLEEAPGKRWLSIGWLIYGLTLSFLIGGGILAREPLVFAIPSLQKLYKAIGLPVTPPGQGLEIQGLRAIHTFTNGREGMILKGEILNTSNQVKPLPPVHIVYRLAKACQSASPLVNRLSLKDSSLPPCQPIRWSFALTQDRLLAGEKVLFETPLQALPPKDAQGYIHF